MVAPVPSAGQAEAGTQGTPSEVVEQPAMETIPLPTMGRTGLPTALVAPTMAGATQPVRTPPTQAEVAATMIGGSQPGAIVAAPGEPARPVPSATQVMASSVGRTEGDAAKGS